MHALQDLQRREEKARGLLVGSKIEVDGLHWPEAIDGSANGQVDDVRKNISQYLRLLLSLTEMIPQVRKVTNELNERKEAVTRAESKLEMSWQHRPLPVDEMRRLGQNIPPGYNHDQAIRDWESNTMNELHDKKEKRAQEVTPAQEAYDNVQTIMRGEVQKLRECVQLINELLANITEKKPPTPLNGKARTTFLANDEAVGKYFDRRDRKRQLARIKKNGGSAPPTPKKILKKKGPPSSRIPLSPAPSSGNGVQVVSASNLHTEIIVNETNIR